MLGGGREEGVDYYTKNFCYDFCTIAGVVILLFVGPPALGPPAGANSSKLIVTYRYLVLGGPNTYGVEVPHKGGCTRPLRKNPT